MKKIAHLFLLLGCSLGFLHSSNDPMEVNNKKALRMLEECPDEYKLTQVLPVTTSFIDFREDDLKPLQKDYEALAEQGFIKLDKKGEMYHITFTELAEDYLLSPKEASKYNSAYGRTSVFASSIKYVISSKRKVEKVLEIQERPRVNIAEVTTKLEIIDETPFYFLESKYDFKQQKRFVFRMTTEGWKYCKPQ